MKSERAQRGLFFALVIFFISLEFIFVTGHELQQYNVTFQLPHQASGWEKSEMEQGWFRPRFLGNTYSVDHVYAKMDQKVSLYATVYPVQDAQSELINFNNYVFNKEKWRLIEKRRRTVQIEEGEFWVNELELDGPRGEKKLLWYWYSVSNVLTPSETKAKLLQLKNAFWNNEGSAVVALSAQMDDDTASASQVLKDFVQDNKVLSADIEGVGSLNLYGL